MDVLGIDNTAVIADGVSFGTQKLASITVEADYRATSYVEAAAGAAGGRSIAPVIALTVSGVNSAAELGKVASGTDIVDGDVSVTAVGSMTRELYADANTVGSGVGVGASFGVSVINDEASAHVDRSLEAANVIVDASSISRILEKVTASSKGATPQPSTMDAGSSSTLKPSSDDYDKLLSDKKNTSGSDVSSLQKKGGPDAFADSAMSALDTLTGRLSSLTKGNRLSQTSATQLGANRPNAATAEGSIMVAASAAVNVHYNKSSASIGNGLSITSNGKLDVKSLIDTDAIIYADSSATNSTTGVGVGVAVNYVNTENYAKVGTSKLDAAGDLNVVADIVEAAEKRALEEILADMLTYLSDMYGAQVLLDAMIEQLSAEDLDTLLKEHAELGADYDQLSDSDKKRVQALVLEVLIAELKSEPMDTSSALMGELAEAMVDELLATLADPNFMVDLLTSSLTGGGVSGPLAQQFETFFAKTGLTGEVMMKRIRDALAVALTEKYGNPSEIEGVGSQISTSAVSGVGAANVGVAGSAAITLVNAKTEASIADANEYTSETNKVVKSQTGNVTIYARSAQRIYSTASASASNNGLPIKNKNGSGKTGGKVGIGASFAISITDVSSIARLGNGRNLTADALSVIGETQNDIDTVSVAGQDPIGRQQVVTPTVPSLGDPVVSANNTSTKQISADASVALTIIDNKVHAIIAPNVHLTLNGGNLIKTEYSASKDEQGNPIYEYANLYVRAWQRGQTIATASGFASGGTAAVGAAVAANLASSDVLASVEGSGTIKGKVRVEAITSNEDEANALATVVGASLDRYFEKIRDIITTLNILDNPPTNGTNIRLMNKINSFANPAMSKIGGATTGMPVVSILLSGLPINLPATPNGGSTVSDALNGTGAAIPAVDNSAAGKSKQLNIAAAVAVNITEHAAKALFDGDFTAQEVNVNAENRGNFRAYATGATITMPTDLNTNNISAAVGVSVNGNSADAQLGGTVTAEGSENTTKNDGAVRVTSKLTQNQDGKYRGLLAAQSIAAAFGGKTGAAGIAGAVSVVIAEASANAEILGGSVINGGDIDVEATEKSRLAIRAGGVMSGGQTAGIGASFALIYANNDLSAKVGDGAEITADKLTVDASRIAVKQEDYKFPFDTSTLFTASSDGSVPKEKGLIHVNLSDGTKNENGEKGENSIEVTLGADDIMKLVDMLNYLTSVNYYIESIAGAVAAPTSATNKAAVSGAMSMLFTNGTAKATIGDGAKIHLNGDLKVNAQSNTTSRMVGGSLAVSRQYGVGANVAALDENDKIYATIGNGTVVDKVGNVDVTAVSQSDVLAVTVAAAAATGAGGGGASIGGGLNVLLRNNDVRAKIGYEIPEEDEEEGTVDTDAGTGAEGETGTEAEDTAKTNILSSGKVNVSAQNFSDLIMVSTSVSGAVGASPAAGGTFATIVTKNTTEASVASNVTIEAATDAIVNAQSKENLINVLASMSASSGAQGVAGTLGVLVSQSDTLAFIGNNTSITAKNGTVEILANGDVNEIVVFAAASASGGTAAAGATVNVNVFEHKVRTLVGENAKLIAEKVEAGKNVIIMAKGKDQTILVTFAGAASTGSGISGTISTLVGKDTVTSDIQQGTYIEAGDTVVVYADLDTGLYDAAGAIAASTGTNSVGATLSTLVVGNEVRSTLGNSVTAIAHASILKDGVGSLSDAGVKLPNREAKRRGTIIRANARSTLLMVSVSGSASANVAVGGVANTLVASNTVKATVGTGGTLIAGYASETDTDADGENAEVAVEADDETDIINLAGGVSAATNAGVGATVVSMVYDKDVEASVSTGGLIRASGTVTVDADSSDKIYLMSLSFAGGGKVGVQVSANTQVFQNSVDAKLGGTVNAVGNVTVKANSLADVFNMAAAVSAAGTAAVTPVAVVTYFKSETIAQLESDASIDTDGAVNVTSDSDELVSLDMLGVAASGTASVSGGVSLLISKGKTKAYANSGASVTGSGVKFAANDYYELVSASALAAASGTAGVAVNAVISVLKTTVSAGVGEGTAPESGAGSITAEGADGAVEILAESKRDIIEVAATVAGGQVGVGATLMVTVAGGKLPQDAADTLIYGGKSTGAADQDKTFDAEAFANDAFSGNNPYLSEYEKSLDDLSKDIEGDGVYQSDTQVGTSTKQEDEKTVSSFDGSSGYRSEDFDDADFEDGDQGKDDKDNKDDTEKFERGENQEFDPEKNSDITNASKLGPQIHETLIYDDCVQAFVGKDVSVESKKDIAVEAKGLTNVDMVTATVSGGAYAAVSAGVAVAVLYSNVEAKVYDGAKLNADGEIKISATSCSDEVEDTDNEDEKERNKALNSALGLGSSANALKKRSIRVISVSGGGAIAAVPVAIATLVLENNTSAVMNGNVTGAANLKVNATSNYPLTLATTLSAGGGVVTVNASVAVVANTGRMESSIGGTADISKTAAIEVKSIGTTDASSFATTIGGGAVAVNAGISLSINRMVANTFIGQGVTISNEAKTISVTSTNTTTAYARIIGATVGGTAVTTNVALAIVEPKIYTFIGVNGEKGSSATAGSINAEDATITVSGTTTSDASASVLALAAGGQAVGGNILLVFNKTDAVTGILKKSVEASTIDIDASMTSNAQAILGSANVGTTAVGVGVSYVHLKAGNLAQIDTTGVSVKANTISLNAGTKENQNSATAKADTIAGSAGVVAVGVNTAIADNQSTNNAIITGDAAGSLKAKTKLEVLAYGNATASASITGLNAGITSVAASFSIAVLRSEQIAKAGGKITETASLKVESHFNRKFDTAGKDITTDDEKDVSTSKITVGAGGLISATANVSAAYARSSVKAIVAPVELNINGDVNVESNGYAGVKSTICNVSSPVGSVSMAAMLGLAFAQGKFDASVQVGEGSSVEANKLSVTANYLSRAVADVIPSASGVDANKLNVKINLATAVASASANASIEGVADLEGNKKGGTVTVGAVEVSATGTSYANAVIGTPEFTANKVTVAANVNVAKVKSVQTAHIDDVSLTADRRGGKDGSVKVTSTLNDGRTYTANASLGGTGLYDSKKEAVSVSMVSAKANVAVALADAVSSAYITGADLNADGELKLLSTGVSIANASVPMESGKVSAIGIGVNALYAKAEGEFNAYVTVPKGKQAKASKITIESIYTTKADALSQQPIGGVVISISGADVKTNVASASTETDSQTGINGEGMANATSSITVTADGTATAKAAFGGATVSVDAVSVAVNYSAASVGGTQSAFVDCGEVNASSVSVNSYFNDAKDSDSNPSEGADASVGNTAGGSADISVVGADASVANASVSASAEARFGAAKGTIFGNVNVKTIANSLAKAYVLQPDASLELYKGSVVNVTATAGGAFTATANAKLDPADANAEIKLSRLNVETDTMTIADARAKQAGVDFSLGSIETNFANASATSTVNAGLFGSGKLTASYSGKETGVKIYAKGIAHAEAVIDGSDFGAAAVSLVANNANATVSATQNAYIKDASVTANAVKVASDFNLKVNNAHKYGAISKVGSNSGTELAMTSLVTSNSNATISGSVSATISDAKITINGGNLDVLLTANSYANADIQMPSSISYYNVSLIQTNAQAGGTFTAKIADENGGSNIDATKVTVSNDFDMYAYAANGPVGGFKASMLDGEVYLAEANTNGTAESSVDIKGLLKADTLNVIASGIILAKAEGRTAEFSITGVEITLNKSVATSDATLKASAGASDGGVIDVGGLSVKANTENANAESTTGASAGKQNSLTLVGASASNNVAEAHSKVTAMSKLTGDANSTIKANAIDVIANVKSAATAKALASYGVSVASMGNLEALSTTLDNVQAGVEGVNVETTGDVDVNATDDTSSKASAEAPGNLSVFNGGKTKVSAKVGKADASTTSQTDGGKTSNVAEANRNTVGVFLGEGAKILSTGGNVSFTAYNTGIAEASFIKKGSYNIAQVSDATIPTESYYYTFARIDKDTAIDAYGDVSFIAQDYAKSVSKVQTSTVSLGFNADKTYGKNNQDVKNSITVGATNIMAGGKLDIKAISDSYMYAYTYADSTGGFYSGSYLYAYNDMVRSTKINVSEGAALESDFGDLNICAQAGVNDYIYTYSRIKGKGFVAIGHSKVVNTTDTDVAVDIERGASIKSTFNTVNLLADASAGSVYAYGYIYNQSVGNEVKPQSYNNVYLDAIVNIGQTGAGKVNIVGDIVNARAFNGAMGIKAEGYSRGKGLGVHIVCESGNTLKSNVKVNINNASLKGYDEVNIKSESDPVASSSFTDKNVEAAPYSYAQGIGDANANSDIGGYVTSKVVIGGNVDIISAKATIASDAFKGSISRNPRTKRDGIASAEKKRTGTFTTSDESTTIDKNAVFYISDAAGGIVIDISNRGGVRAVGLARQPVKNPSTVKRRDGNIVVDDIQNNLNGTLTVDASLNGNKVYDQRWIESIEIINRTTDKLTINNITLNNSSYIKPTVNSKGGSYTDTVSYYRPEVSVESRTSGAVDIQGLIANSTGKVSFEWTNEAGDLTCINGGLQLQNSENGSNPDEAVKVPPVWASHLSIVNANNIGENEEKRFSAYLFKYGTADGTVEIDSVGNSYTSFTPAEMIDVSSTEAMPDSVQKPFNLKLNVEKVYAGDVNDIELNSGVRIYRLEGTATVAVPVPGSLNYIAGVLKPLTTQVSLDKEAMQRYLKSYDAEQEMYIYELPNGSLIYTDENGEILRIREKIGENKEYGFADETAKTETLLSTTPVYSDITFNNYTLLPTQNIVKIGEGVELNYVTGEISVAKGSSVTVLFASLDGTWIMNNLNNFEFYVVGENGERTQSSVTYWYDFNGKKYFYVGTKPTEDNIIKNNDDDPDNPAYVLAYDENGKLLEAYRLVHNGMTEDEEGSKYLSFAQREVTEPYINEAGDLVGNYPFDGVDYPAYASWDYTWAFTDDEGNYTTKICSLAELGLDVKGTILENAYFCYNVDSEYNNNETLELCNIAGINEGSLIFEIDRSGTFFLMPTDYKANFTDADTLATVADLLSKFYFVFEAEAEESYTHVSYATPHPEGGWGLVKDKSLLERKLALSAGELTTMNVVIEPNANGKNSIILNADADGNVRDDSGSDSSSLTIRGEMNKVPLRTSTLPVSTSVQAYRISDMLYVTSGTNGGKLVLGSKDFGYEGFYNGSSYTSNSISAQLAQGSVIISSDQMAQLERLTSDVAQLADGRYFKLTGSDAYSATSWTQIAYKIEQETVNGRSVAVTTVLDTTNNNNELLKIYELDGVLYHNLMNGYIAGSDGSVTKVGATELNMRVFELNELEYMLGSVKGKSTTIRLNDTGAKLTPKAADPANLIADDALIISDNATIASADNPLTIVPYTEGVDPKLNFATQVKQATLTSEVHISVEGDGSLADDVAQKIIIDGGLLDYSASGDIDFTEIHLTNGAELDLDAGGNITGKVLNAYIDATGDTDAKLNAGGNITINTVTLDDNNASISAAGDVSFTDRFDVSNTDNDNTEKTQITAGGSFTAGPTKIGNVASTANGTVDVTISAGTDLSFIDSLNAAKAEIELNGGLDEARIGSMTVEGKTNISSSTVNVDVDGSIFHKDDVAIDASTVDYTADDDLIFDGKTQITSSSDVTMKIGGDILHEDEAEFIDSAVDYTSGGSIRHNRKNKVQNAEINYKSEDGLTFESEYEATDSEMTYIVGGDTAFKDEIIQKNSSFKLDGEGTLSMTKADLSNGSFDAETDGNISFDIIEARDNDLILNAHKGNISTNSKDGYIRFRDDATTSGATDEKLSLSAGDAVMDAASNVGNIGSESNPLMLDTDDVLFVPAANDYFIESVELVGDDLYQGRRPTTIIAEGYEKTEDGFALVKGDYIADASNDSISSLETVYVELIQQSASEIAEMLTGEDRLDRAEWSQLLNASAIEALLKQGDIAANTATELLITHNPDAQITVQEIRALFKQGEAIADGEDKTGYEKLAELLAPTINNYKLDKTGTALSDRVLSDEKLAQWLEKGIENNAVDMNSLETAIRDALTTEEIAELIERAWTLADYDSRLETRPDDPKPRGIEIRVGNAVGSAFVTNDGDITITQDSGTLTAGAVLSDRGDVSLTNKDGSIEGDKNEEINILAKNVNLKASQGVGSTYETRLKLEQRENELTLVANIKKPTGDVENGYGDTNVEALDSSGKPTENIDEKEKWSLETLFDFDWLRVERPERAMQLNIEAGGDVNVEERTGDMGLGNVVVRNGDANLIADGAIVDNRNDGDSKSNIEISDGNATIEAKNDAIGTETERIITDVDGTITAKADGDINIADKGTLDLIAQSENGQVNASAEDDLNLKNIAGDLIVGPIEAGGNVNIVSEGSIVEGDSHGRDAFVSGNSIDMIAKNGHIGTAENTFEVDTDAANGGTLSAAGEYLNITEISGNLILKDIDSETDASLTSPEDILDANEKRIDQAVEKQKDANAAKAEADKAETEAFIREEQAKLAEEELKKAQDAADKALRNTEAAIQDALDDANDKLNQLDPETEGDEIAEQQKLIESLEKKLANATVNKDKLEKALEDAQKALEEAEDKNEAAQKAANDAAQRADQLKTDAENKQAEADAAKDAATAADTTITVGGDLSLNAGGDIGAENEGLSMRVDGDVDANAGLNEEADDANIHITGTGDLNFEEITVPGQIDISTIGGNITGDGTLKGESIDANALDGDVGQKDKPLEVSVDHVDAQGDNVYIRNDKDTEIGQITAKDDVTLDSKGDVTGDATSEPNIIANDVTIRTDGDIGTKDDPLKTDTGSFHGSGDDIHLDNSSKDLDISDVESDGLHVKTDGNVNGKDIVTGDITIIAGGYIGEKDNPFTFWADGNVIIKAGLGIPYYINLYQPSHAKDEAQGHALQMVVFVYRFDIRINGEDMALYLLIGMDDDGMLVVLGAFIGEKDADEAFYLEMLNILKDEWQLAEVGIFFFNGLNGFVEAGKMIYPNAEFMDISELMEVNAEMTEEEIQQMKRELMTELLTNQVTELDELLEALGELNDCMNAVVETEFADEQAAMDAIKDAIEAFTAQNPNWVDSRKLSCPICALN